MYHKTLCTGCGRCIAVCPTGAIRHDETYGLVTDTALCTRCGRCAEACLNESRELVGKSMTVGAVLKILRRDRRYYDNSGGGVTLTGGEPLAQCAFARELLKSCKEESIHTAIETCGYVDWSCLKSVLPTLDLMFYDIKHFNPEMHHAFTGQSNDRILANLSRAAKAFDSGEIIVRVPIIPTFNDNVAAISEIFEFVEALPNISRIELLPYHRLGIVKYEGLGRCYTLRDLDPLQRHDLEELRTLGEKYRVEVRIDST